MKWLLRGLVLALLTYAYYALPAIGHVNHRTLGTSVGTTCTVRKRGRRCWTASARSPVPEVPALARGRAKLREQGRLGRWVSQVVPRPGQECPAGPAHR